MSALARARRSLRMLIQVSDGSVSGLAVSGRAYDALLAVRACPAGRDITITDLARELGLRTNTVVELVDRLEKRGLMRRAIVFSDRRRTALHLTAEGYEAVNQVASRDFEELKRAKELLKVVREI